MKLFIHAIASIVDANTGHGLNLTRDNRSESHESHARIIRARSFGDLFARLGDAVGNLVERYRERAQERRDLAELSRMNDRLLKDIGLTRGDVLAVQMGTTTLDELYAERNARRQPAAAEIKAIDGARAVLPQKKSVNEERFDTRECA